MLLFLLGFQTRFRRLPQASAIYAQNMRKRRPLISLRF